MDFGGQQAYGLQWVEAGACSGKESRKAQCVFSRDFGGIMLWGNSKPGLGVGNVSSLIFYFRRRIPQLPPHLPLWLFHEWIRLALQLYNSFYRSYVLRGSGQRLQDGVQGSHPGSEDSDWRWEPQDWLSAHFSPATFLPSFISLLNELDKGLMFCFTNYWIMLPGCLWWW